jgi:cell wall assembly regulator SMI1
MKTVKEIWEEFKNAYKIYNDSGPAWYEGKPKRINTATGWCAGWIPFASFQGNCTITDVSPTKDGTFGQVFETNYQEADEVLFLSVTD